jgi:hypothetical protein
MLPIALICPFLIVPLVKPKEQSKMDKPERLAT